MRRLTLILSDLYLPDEAVHSQLTRALAMPALEALLRFAEPSRRITDWRSWLAAQLAPDLAGQPIARACARGLLDARAAASAWLATPVHLEARLDHVRLTDRGLLRLGADERSAWCAEFARVFGPQYTLHDAGERGFLLTGVARTETSTVDPARLLDSDIGPALPRGPDAAELRRLGAEIEMWLHGALLNGAREQARLPRLSGLWLWGGGGTGAATTVAARAEATSDLHLFGADPFVTSLARGSAGNASATFLDIAGFAGHAVVEQTPMTGPEEQSLTALEARWFAPVRAALKDASLAEFDVIANDRWFRMRSGGSWKFWRRRVHWLQRLATPS
jgi:hypothetical protein